MKQKWIAGAFDRILAQSKREHFLKFSSRGFSLFCGFCVVFKKPGESRGIFRFPLRAISYQISGGFDQTGVCVRTQLADIGKLFILTTLKPFGNIAFRMLYFLKRVSREQARSKIHDFTGFPCRIIRVIPAQEDMVTQRFYTAEIFRVIILFRRSFVVLQNNACFFMNIITDDFFNAAAAGITEHFTLIDVVLLKGILVNSTVFRTRKDGAGDSAAKQVYKKLFK